MKTSSLVAFLLFIVLCLLALFNMPMVFADVLMPPPAGYAITVSAHNTPAT